MSLTSLSTIVEAALLLGADEVPGLSAAELALVQANRTGLEVGLLREAIQAGLDPLGDAFCRIRSAQERRPLGQTYTPAAVVEAMVAWVPRSGPARKPFPARRCRRGWPATRGQHAARRGRLAAVVPATPRQPRGSSRLRQPQVLPTHGARPPLPREQPPHGTRREGERQALLDGRVPGHPALFRSEAGGAARGAEQRPRQPPRARTSPPPRAPEAVL